MYMMYIYIYIHTYIYIYREREIHCIGRPGGNPRPPPEQTPGNRVKNLKERLTESQQNQNIV